MNDLPETMPQFIKLKRSFPTRYGNTFLGITITARNLLSSYTWRHFIILRAVNENLLSMSAAVRMGWSALSGAFG